MKKVLLLATLLLHLTLTAQKIEVKTTEIQSYISGMYQPGEMVISDIVIEFNEDKIYLKGESLFLELTILDLKKNDDLSFIGYSLKNNNGGRLYLLLKKDDATLYFDLLNDRYMERVIFNF